MTITTNIFAQSWNVYGNSISNGSFIGTKNNLPLIFKTNTGNDGVGSFPQMVITGGVEPNKGFVGINVINPTERLHVNQGGILVQNAITSKSGPFLRFTDNNNKKISLQLENKGPINNGLTFKVQPENGQTIDNVLFVTANRRNGGPLEGAIGIGTDIPMEKLQIKNGNVIISNNETYWSYYGFNNAEQNILNFSGMAYIYDTPFNRQKGLALFLNPPYTDQYLIYPFFISNSEPFTNNVGIGTDLPTQKLHIASGNILITKNSFYEHAPGNENGSILFGDNIDEEYPYGHWGIGYDDLHDGQTKGLNFWKPWDNEGGTQNAVLFLSSARQYLGNVGIGTAIPTQKLSVNGAVLAKEVIVTLDDDSWPTTRKDTWPDYVFSTNYDLMNLLELKTYVNANKHLPGVPSTKEVLDEGIRLGEMNAILVEKVEEMTLYIIDLQEQINELKQQLQNK